MSRSDSTEQDTPLLSGSGPDFQSGLAVRAEGSVLRAIGEIDLHTVPILQEGVRLLLLTEGPILTLDLTETTYCDSSGLAVIIRLAKRLAVDQRKLRLKIRTGGQPDHHITISQLDSFLGVERVSSIGTSTQQAEVEKEMELAEEILDREVLSR